ncbi:hypothetical protein MSPP1_000301 [Malassezia sp. CBS 17886]|nr:hypothetical protein MSPP1_000301 [Malassezia sp. CBS 17886]
MASGRKSLPAAAAPLADKENRSMHASPRKRGGSVRKRAVSIGVPGAAAAPHGAPPAAGARESPQRTAHSLRRMAPRKSAIRPTPQVFQSPTGLGPNPEREHIRAGSNMSDIEQLVERAARDGLETLREEEHVREEGPAREEEHAVYLSPGLPNPFSALYRASSASPTKALGSARSLESPERASHTIAVVPREDAQTARKRRRVTFSAHQDKADFAQDEPTMRIRPAPEHGVWESEDADASGNTTASSEEVSMDLTMDASARGYVPVAEEHAAFAPLPRAHAVFSTASPADSEASDVSRTMEMTQAWQARSEDEGEARSEDEGEARSEDEGDASAELDSPTPSQRDDRTVDMDLTRVHTAVATRDTDRSFAEETMEMTMAYGRIHAHGAGRGAHGGEPRTMELPRREPVSHVASLEPTSLGDVSPGDGSPWDMSASNASASDMSLDASAMEMSAVWTAGDGGDAPQAPGAPPIPVHSPLHPKTSARSPSGLGTPPRSPERRQTMFLSPNRRRAVDGTRGERAERGGTPRASTATGSTPRPFQHAMPPSPPSASRAHEHPASPSTPTRFRQSLRGGIPSPAYQHSPAGRRRLSIGGRGAGTGATRGGTEGGGTPRFGALSPSAASLPATPSNEREARDVAPATYAAPRDASHELPLSPVAHGRHSVGGVGDADQPHFPRSPFIHSLIKQCTYAQGSPVRELSVLDDAEAEETDGNASFHLELSEFLSLIGLKFHEDMTASRALPTRPNGGARASIVTHAQAAGGAAPMLLALRNACAELKQHVDEGRGRLVAMERDFFARPPAFVQEWGQLVDDDMRRSMKGQLHVHKQAARAAAMHDYYGWRTDVQFDEEIVVTLLRHREVLQDAHDALQTQHAQLCGELLPVLRARHAALHERVALARRRQQAIHECDQDELRQLMESIEEQNHVLQMMHAKQTDLEAQQQRLRARLDDVHEKRTQTEEEIFAARAICEQIQGCTTAQLVRLQRQIQHLETLMQWRITNKTSTLLQMMHAHAFSVSMELDGRRGTVKRIAVAPSAASEDSALHASALAIVRARFKEHTPDDVPGVLRTVTSVWLAARRAGAEIVRLRSHMPVSLVAGGADSSVDAGVLQIVATALLRRQRAKALVFLDVDLSAPLPFLPHTAYVDGVYGAVETDAMAHLIQQALRKNAHAIGALDGAVVDACVAMDA